MGDEMKDLTPREVRLCRKAFADGAGWRNSGFGNAHHEAAKWYPMPMVEVPRVVEARDRCGAVHKFRLIDGRLQTITPNGKEWEAYESHDNAVAIASLLATPTHRVPADEATP